ncbi:MAG: hypothetical protein NT154_18485, partial [Verrucomicrobia bacterium]|nr:hypothetical protein [Verrucomicrobiota bacterium]
MIGSTYWFSPAPSEVSSSRISLDFGLRSVDFFFRELVVPELGRIWFVRQLSWPLASLALHESIQRQGSNAPKPTAICHGIEALACKMEYQVDPQGPFERILGSRAFRHDHEVFLEAAVQRFSGLRPRQRAELGSILVYLMLDGHASASRQSVLPPGRVPGLHEFQPRGVDSTSLLHAKLALLAFAPNRTADPVHMRLAVLTANFTYTSARQQLEL